MITMKRSVPLILLFVLFSMNSCKLLGLLKDDCEETEAPEINFAMKAGGTVKFTSFEGTDITSQFEGKGITISFYKDHCNGTIRGPFDHNYTIDKYGQLWNNSSGTWSFKMNNTEDYMRTRIYYEGSYVGLPFYDGYDAMKPFDAKTVYHEYMITIDLKQDNTSVQDAIADRVN